MANDWLKQVRQKTQDIAQSEQVQAAAAKAKTKWASLSGRGKLVAVAVGLLVIWLVYRFLFGGGGPPYADLVKRATKIIEKQEASLLKEHDVENIRAVPERELEAAATESQRQIDEIASKYKPLPIALDKSAQELISDIESLPPVSVSSFMGRGWSIPLKFTAKSQIRKMNSGLVCKVYDGDGLVCKETDVWTETAGSPGERIHAGLVLSDDELSKACKLRVFGGK